MVILTELFNYWSIFSVRECGVQSVTCEVPILWGVKCRVLELSKDPLSISDCQLDEGRELVAR